MRHWIFFALVLALLLCTNAGAAIPLYTGSFTVATGGVVNDPNAPNAGNDCVGLVTFNYTYNQNCVQSIAVGTGLTLGGTAANPILSISGSAGVQSISCQGNITCTTGATPTIQEIANPSWTTANATGNFYAGGASGSAYVALGNNLGAATVISNVNNPQAILMPNLDGTSFVTYIGTYAADTVQGYHCNDFRVGRWNGTTSTTDFCVDNAANLGVAGNITASNFFNGSRAEWKRNIMGIDGLAIVENTHTAQYDCADPRCGPVGEHKVGIIANDTTAEIAGKGHDRYDGFALAAADADAIKALQREIVSLKAQITKLQAGRVIPGH